MRDPCSYQPEFNELPPGWRIDRLDSVFSIQQGKQISKKTRIGANQQPFLRTRNVLWGKLDLADLDQMHFSEAEENRLRLEPGDLLVCEGGDIGRTAIWRGDVAQCFYQNHLHRLRLINGDADPEFVLFWLWYAFNVGKVYFGRGNVTTIPNLSQSKLAELPILLPPLTTQKKIAAVLGLVRRAIEEQDRLIALTTELNKALMHKLFTEGLLGEPQKMTEIGPIPERWERTTLGTLASRPHGFLQTGPFGSQLHKEDYQEEGVGVVNPTDLLGNRINHENVPRISLEKAQQLERHRLEAGDILFARRGEIGRHGLVTQAETGWLCGTGCFLARIRQEQVDNRFLCSLISTSGVATWLNGHAAGAIMPNLNNTVLRSMPVYLPKIDVQTEIANALVSLEMKISLGNSRRDSLLDCFRSLLALLMSAQLSVKGK